MKTYSLVVMAAGMASRFGGPKQVMPIDDEGNFIIDYSVYDAIRAGFNEVVFIIRKENREVFDKTVGDRLKGKIVVKYAYQEMDDIPVKFDYGKRVKPWGTAHAILAARNIVKGSFLLINADDFYGYDSFKQAFTFLSSCDKPYKYASISFELKNTAWGGETVKRGILKLENGKILDFMESKATIEGDNAKIEPLDGREPRKMSSDIPVSMNMFAFQHDVFEIMQEFIEDFFKLPREEILEGEAFAPVALKLNIEKGKIEMDNIMSKNKWLGITYKEDLAMVKKEVERLKAENVYPKSLWN